MEVNPSTVVSIGRRAMAIIKEEEIVGFNIENETVCRDCTSTEEEENVDLSNIILENDSAVDWFFCDRCKKRFG